MIVKAKEGSKKIHLSEEEITLDQLKECGHILYTPNIPIEERIIEIHNEKIHRPVDWQTDMEWKNESLKLHKKVMNEHNKLYEVIAEEVKSTLQRMAASNVLQTEDKVFPEGTRLQDLDLEKIRFNQVFIAGLGNLKIME